jgi:arabinofuranosyltransferase
LSKRSPFADVAIMSCLVAFIALFSIIVVDFSERPFEDSAILMRYAEHFAHGHGFVWNVGDKPVDGATDFLFTVVVGLLAKAGVSLEFATRSIGFVSHVLTVLLIYWFLRRRLKTGYLPALASSLYLAVGPGLYYVAAYFGTPFFGLFSCITWYAAMTIVQEGETRRRALIFAAAAIVTALIRPEGVILSALMLAAVVYLKGLRSCRRTIMYYLGIFLIVGGAYFLWRWQYFGHPFPNPFYKKGGWRLHPGSLVASVINVMKLCWPFLLIFTFGFYSPKVSRMTVAFSIPIFGFAFAFVLLSNAMNFAARFQYAIVPVVLMSWWPLLAGIKDDLSLLVRREISLRKRRTLVLAAVVFSLGAIIYQGIVGRLTYGSDGRYTAALILRDYREKGYCIATTEAGLLPLYSGWRAIDAWGLNDPWIARNKGITEEYLDRFRPEVIMFHAYFSPLVPAEGGSEWDKMVMVMKTYAENNGYVLAGVFGDTPYSTHYYYVRLGFPDSAELAKRIRTIEHYGSGKRAINYALLGVPSP